MKIINSGNFAKYHQKPSRVEPSSFSPYPSVLW